MPPRSQRRPRRDEPFPDHHVTAVVVAHDGAHWLSDCLTALGEQRRRPQRVVAVDTGSTDGSYDVLVDKLGEDSVAQQPRRAALADAVQAALAVNGTLSGAGRADAAASWIWLLHDDCIADTDALAELLAEATRSPSATVLGPKLLTGDGRYLLEVGVTTDGSGERQTGLESRELDQGQHDSVGDVLAVSTAGMLVRRDVWERLGGLDPTWPVVGDDVDFGWRANAAGERVVVAPRAVVRHSAALLAGRRHPASLESRPRVVARRHGMQVVLANTAAMLVPLLALRYLVEALLRAAGLLLARSPRAAGDELVATVTTLARPGVIVRARRRRRATRVRSHREIRPLLARPALRLRRLADSVAAGVGGERAVERRTRRRAPVESGPVADEATGLGADDAGALRRLFARPAVALTIALAVLGLVASRGVLGSSLHGGRLLAAPGGASDLWSTYTSAWHPVGLGSTVVAPPWIAVIALLSTLLLGKAWLAVAVLLLGAMPLAGLSAYLASGAVTRSTWLRVWAAVTYAVLPTATGAVADGRLDVVATVIVLPLAMRAFVGAVRPEAGWHRVAGAALLMAVVCAFTPVLWPALLVAGAVGIVVGVRRRRVAALARLAGLLAIVALLLLPWSATLVVHPRHLLVGAGLVDQLTNHRSPEAIGLLLLRPGGPAQPPMWVLAPLVIAALAGLSRAHRRGRARLGIVVFVVAVAGALGVAHLRYWTGTLLALAAVGALVAATVAADDARATLARHDFGWRQPATALLAAAAAIGTAVAGVGWLVRGAEHPLTSANPQVLPVFAAAQLADPASSRALVLRHDGRQVRYALVRTPAGLRLGDADVAPDANAVQRQLTPDVERVVAGDEAAAADLSRFAVALIVVPGNDSGVLHGLAGVDGLTKVPTPGAVVWRTPVRAGELMVLAADASSSTPLPAASGSARTRVAPGVPGRVLVLAEPVSTHWKATLDGRPLPRARHGWPQAWVLPASGGRLEVSRSGDTRGAWLAAQLAVAICVAFAAVPARRRRSDEEGAA